MTEYNHGLIDKQPRKTDFIVGGGNAVVAVSLLKTKDWRPFLSSGESQLSVSFDTMACVSFSAINVIEGILNYKVKNNLLNEDDFIWLKDKGYFDSNGNIEFSDRFTAKMSGTTSVGNWLYKVGDSIRKDGLVPETTWSYPRDESSFSRSDYYKEIPQAIIELGKEFTTRFKINYEWVRGVKNFIDNLEFSPLQVMGFAWPDVNPDGSYPRSNNKFNHAFTLVHKDQLRIIEDQYKVRDSFKKRLAEDYILGDNAMRYVVTNKLIIKEEDMPMLYKVKDKSAVYELWEDGKYHPIAHESYVINKYGGWEMVKTEIMESINPSKVGTTIGEYGWLIQAIISMLTSFTKLKGKVYGKK